MRMIFLKIKSFYFWLSVIGFALITMLCGYSYIQIVNRAKMRTESLAKQVRLIAQEEISKYVFGLQGAKGSLIADHYSFNRKLFRSYAESRDMFSNFPGAVGFGLIRYVPENQVQSKFQSNLKTHSKKSASSTFHEHDLIVELFEPAEKSHLLPTSNFRFDSDFTSTALQSAESGEPLIAKSSGNLPNAHSFDFIYLMPLYSTTTNPKVASDRLSKLIGWVFSPILFKDVATQIKLKSPPDLKVIINTEAEPKFSISTASAKSPEPWLTFTSSVQLPELNWTIYVTDLSDSHTKSIFALGLIYVLSLMVFAFSGNLIYRANQNRDKSVIEQALWLKAIVEGAGHAVIATTPDGVITNFNPAAERLLGYSSLEVVNKWTPAIFHEFGEVQSRSQELSKEMGISIEPGFETFIHKSKLGNPDINEWTYITKDRKRVPVRLCITTIRNTAGEIIGFLGIAEDLSEQKKLLETIENQKAKMLESAKLSLLGEMAAGIAHEINSPLAIILAKADLLITKLQRDKFNVSAAIEQLTKISSTAVRIGKIVKGLRNFSRNSAEDPLELVNISEVLDSTFELCREKIHFKQIHVFESEGLTPDLLVIGRSTEISQVFMNLISNSIDAIENLDQKWIKISFLKDTLSVKMVFTDSGNGIPKSVEDKMMNPFFTTKEVGKGTGLGLSISKGIIESYKGKFYYDPSASNTSFIIELPYQVAKTEAA